MAETETEKALHEYGSGVGEEWGSLVPIGSSYFFQPETLESLLLALHIWEVVQGTWKHVAFQEWKRHAIEIEGKTKDCNENKMDSLVHL